MMYITYHTHTHTSGIKQMRHWMCVCACVRFTESFMLFVVCSRFHGSQALHGEITIAQSLTAPSSITSNTLHLFFLSFFLSSFLAVLWFKSLFVCWIVLQHFCLPNLSHQHWLIFGYEGQECLSVVRKPPSNNEGHSLRNLKTGWFFPSFKFSFTLSCHSTRLR